jgi:hypothetical protein
VILQPIVSSLNVLNLAITEEFESAEPVSVSVPTTSHVPYTVSLIALHATKHTSSTNWRGHGDCTLVRRTAHVSRASKGVGGKNAALNHESAPG